MDTNTIIADTVTYVNYSAVIAHIGFDEDAVEAIADYGFNMFFIGDATLPLYDKKYVLDNIVVGYEKYIDELNDNDGDEPSRNLPENIISTYEICTKFWEAVRQGQYINMGE